MNYAWEAALTADRCGIRRESLRYVPVMNGSPYTEIVLEDINNRVLKNPVLQINPLYRFSAQFSRMLDINIEGFEQTRLLVFDVFMHYITQLDLRQGLSRQEFHVRFFLEDLLRGVFGRQVCKALQKFSKEQLYLLVRFILKLYQCGSSTALFREVMRCIYPNSIVYINNDVIRQVLIYLGKRETKMERDKIQFIHDMFLPVNYEVFLFWDFHFGIIDVDATMVIDEMMIF